MNVYVDGFLEENNNISGQGGAEVEIVIKNQDGFDITNECVFEYSLEANYDIQFNYNGLYCVLILGGPLTSSYFNIINDDLIKTVNVNVDPATLPPEGGGDSRH